MQGTEPGGDGALTTVLEGKYRVLAQLGQGGTANVLLAVAQGPAGFNKLVVLKTMKGALRDEPDLPRMFMNEARLAARLNHPNIVQTNEVFESDGLPTIVMEYLEGQTLASVMGRARGNQRFPLPMRLRVISEVLAGLHHSHELTDFDGKPLSVVHRDVSPNNVFVTFEGQVKLLDFGIAKLSGSHIETATGVMKGKLRYMSPEQIGGEDIDRRSDVFACGVMLWEATADARMWNELQDVAIMNRVLNGEIPSPRTVNPQLDPELEAIVMKALAAEKSDRYPNAEALQKALDDYLDGLGAHVRAREIGEAVGALFSDERSETRQRIDARLAKVANLEVSARTRVEKQTAMTWIALIAALAAFAIAGFSIFRNQSTEHARAETRAAAQASGSSREARIAEPPSSAASQARTVTLRVTAFPASATLFLDAERLPGNPYARSYPLESGVQHTLRAQAPGRREAQRTITLEQDLDIVLVLDPLEASVTTKPAATKPAATKPAATKPAATKRPPKSPAASSPAEGATVSTPCEPPYSVDSRGVKKFKPECL